MDVAYKGFASYNQHTKKFKYWTTNDGAPADPGLMSPAVINGNFWVSTSSKLYKVNAADFESVVYDYRDGLPTSFSQGYYMYYDPVGKKMYLPHGEYLVYFPIENKTTLNIPKFDSIYFSKLGVSGGREIFFPDNNLHLRANERNLNVQLSYINFEDGTSTKYFYRLNHDSVWISSDGHPFFTLLNLSPGNYKMEVKAANKAGDASTAVLNFSVAPYFYETTWFKILLVSLLFSGVYGYYKRNVNKSKQKALLHRQITEERMKAFYAQMNPHFVFNSLASISELVASGENQLASQFLKNSVSLSGSHCNKPKKMISLCRNV